MTTPTRRSLYEMTETMWEDNFFTNIPKEIIKHIYDITGWSDLEYDNWSDVAECMWGDYEYELTDDSGSRAEVWSESLPREYTLIHSIWGLYNFWKMKGGHRCGIWHKEEGYLLAEIVWLLLSQSHSHSGVSESEYITYHKKEKGNKKTTFKEAKKQLCHSKGGRGKPWIKGLQEKHGPIIEDKGSSMVLTDKWKCLLRGPVYNYRGE